uniref:Reverse transcriptase n=1 Tax=Cannabis sativa TaxID=3483 RepID=A0A803P1Z2_CANSA
MRPLQRQFVKALDIPLDSIIKQVWEMDDSFISTNKPSCLVQGLTIEADATERMMHGNMAPIVLGTTIKQERGVKGDMEEKSRVDGLMRENQDALNGNIGSLGDALSMWLGGYGSSTVTPSLGREVEITHYSFGPSCLQRVTGIAHFRFENSWTHEPMCYEIVNDCWSNNPLLSIQDKIKVCASTLATWGKEFTGGFKRRIVASKRRMSLFKEKSDEQSIRLFQEAQDQYFGVLAQQDTFWKQRAKQFWLRDGDKNIQNAKLLADLTDEEIRGSIFQMHPDKSPGPDGMGPGFFQKHWDIVGGDVKQLVRNFFDTRNLPGGLNVTNLFLIIKRRIAGYGRSQTIALCNVHYKIVSKVLSNQE